MTPAGQAFLFAGVLFCLSFALIPLVYFADRLRSDFLGKRKGEPSAARRARCPRAGIDD
jgi:hypothetical protein